MKLIAVAIAGILVGAAAMWIYQQAHQPSSFEECFLAESKGRQSNVFLLVRKVCRARFPAGDGQLLQDKDIWGPSPSGAGQPRAN